MRKTVSFPKPQTLIENQVLLKAVRTVQQASYLATKPHLDEVAANSWRMMQDVRKMSLFIREMNELIQLPPLYLLAPEGEE